MYIYSYFYVKVTALQVVRLSDSAIFSETGGHENFIHSSKTSPLGMFKH